MTDTTAQELAGRPIKVEASTLTAYMATIHFADTGEEIGNCHRVEIDMDVAKAGIVAKVSLLCKSADGSSAGGYVTEIGTTDKVELSTLARVEEVR